MKTERYYISVGEPWDFVSPDGENVIKGKILKNINPQCIVFKANYNLKFNDINGDVFILFTRYSGDSFDNLNTLKYMTVTGSVLDFDYDEDMDVIDLKAKSKYVIMGGIHVIER